MCVCADDLPIAKYKSELLIKLLTSICTSAYTRICTSALILACIPVTVVCSFTNNRHAGHFKQIIKVKQAAVNYIT